MMIAVGPWPVSECRQSKRANIADHRRLSYYSGCNRSLVPCGITQTQWIVKKHNFGPLFVVRKKKHPQNNQLERKHPKSNIKNPPHKTPGSSCPKKQGNFPHGGNFCYFSAQRAREGPSGSNPPTPKSFLVHLWQEGVIWTSQTDFSTQIKRWFSNCAKAFRSNVSVMRFWLCFFLVSDNEWSLVQSCQAILRIGTCPDRTWQLTTAGRWSNQSSSAFPTVHPGPHVPTQKGKIRSPPVYHPNVPRHWDSSFRDM